MIGIKRALIRVRLNLPTDHFVCKLNIFRNIVGMSMRYDNLFKKSTITNGLEMKKTHTIHIKRKWRRATKAKIK